MPHPWHISRRTMLRGVGASLALPWLHAMETPRALAAPGDVLDRPPIRLGFVFFPNGVRTTAFRLQDDGPLKELSPTLKPLDPVKQNVSVLTNLWNQNTNGEDGHYRKVAAWLTGTQITKTTGRDLNSGGVSIDQLAAQTYGKSTPLPSLELGTEPVRTGTDNNVGFTRVYGGHISWSSPTMPLPKEIIPRLAFDRLFRSGDASRSGFDPHLPSVQNSLRGDDTSVLDLVREDANSLRRRVGVDDRQKLDEYLESVRSVERQLERTVKPQPRWKNTGEFPMDRPAAGIPRDYREHVRLMLDVMLLAFWTDSTRVASFMFANAVSQRNFSFIEGVRTAHHEASHHQNKPEKLEQYERITTWHVEEFSRMLQRMASLDEGGTSLLDNSMILFGSALADGNSHNPRSLPLVLAGRGGGTLESGRHITYEPNTPLCNLYLSMLHRVGVRAETFGDSTGLLTDLGELS